MAGTFVFGYALDSRLLRRPVRAYVVLAALFVLTMAVWGGGYAFQRTYVRDTDPDKDAVEARKVDWTSPGHGGPFVLYMLYGFFDGTLQPTSSQIYAYWARSCVADIGILAIGNFDQ